MTDAPYPRADPAGAEHLPGDVWASAQLPVGVRLELVGEAKTIRVWYRTTRASLGYRGESAGCTFIAYRGGRKVAEEDAAMGEGMVELTVTGRPDLPLTVYLPEGMGPVVTGVAGVEEVMEPARHQPRWLAYGDAVTQGWLASSPAMAWPAVAGRKLGLDVCNFGYAGTARGEATSAAMLADTAAEVITIAFGLNNWARVPNTASLMVEEVRCFLSIVRDGHPVTPIVFVSPTIRPDAEDMPNRVGATLADLRLAMEEAVQKRQADGDSNLFLVEGLNVMDAEDLEDGLYPGDEGHRRLAAAVGKILRPCMAGIQKTADARMKAEREAASASVTTTETEAPVAFFEPAYPRDMGDGHATATPEATATREAAFVDDALDFVMDDDMAGDPDVSDSYAAPEDQFSTEAAPGTGSEPIMAEVTPAETAAGHNPATDAVLDDSPAVPTALEEPAPVEANPAETDRTQTDQVETDPVEADPVETDPVETDPVETDPVLMEPAPTEASGAAPPEAVVEGFAEVPAVDDDNDDAVAMEPVTPEGAVPDGAVPEGAVPEAASPEAGPSPDETVTGQGEATSPSEAGLTPPTPSASSAPASIPSASSASSAPAPSDTAAAEVASVEPGPGAAKKGKKTQAPKASAPKFTTKSTPIIAPDISVADMVVAALALADHGGQDAAVVETVPPSPGEDAEWQEVRDVAQA